MQISVNAPEVSSRILLVEDEPRIATFVDRALTSHGFIVDRAEGVRRAAELVRSRRYCLVVLDLMLPDGDGRVLLEQMLGRHPGLRVLVLSAQDDVDTRVRCLALGAVDFLAKPFSLKELVARIEARLRTPSTQVTERVVRSGPVSLDITTREAEGDLGRRSLTSREFSLLRYLMMLEGEVATREELLQNIWGLGFDTGTNVVDVYIGRLRAKLGADVIETVRDVGYRLATS